MLTAVPLALTLVLAPQDLDRALQSHALLKRLDLTDLAPAGPFRILVEPPRKPDPEHATRVNELFAPWLVKLAEIAQREVFEPGQLELRTDAQEPALIVLAQLATFQNAARYGRFDAAARVAPWEEFGALVTHWDRSLERLPEVAVRTPVLEAAAMLLLRGYDHRPPEEVGSGWLLPGLAAAIVAHVEGATPEDLEVPPPSPAALARLDPLLGDPERRAAALFSLVDVAAGDDPAIAGRMTRTRASRAGLRLAPEEAEVYFREQAALWVHYLMYGEGGRYRGALVEHLAATLRGAGGPEDLARALELEDLAILDDAFRAHVAVLAGHDVGPPAGAAGAEDAEALAHPELVPPARTDHERLVDALSLAVRGDLDGALRVASVARAGSRSPAVRALLDAECERLEAAVAARDAFVRSLPGGGKKLRLTIAGKATAVAVARIEEGELVLDGARGGVERVAIAALPPRDLARSMRGNAPPYVAAYLALVAGDERWDRGLKEDSAGARALVRDAEELGPLLVDARARAALIGLAREEPASALEREAFVARLAAAAREFAATETMRAARGGMRARARELCVELFSGEGLEGSLEGKFEALADGYVRLTYEFDREEELADFAAIDGYLPERVAKLPALDTGEEKPGVRVRGGNLEGLGDVALRHVLPMQAPLKASYELLYGRARPGRVRNATVLVAVCDDGAGSYVGAWDLFDLEAIDRATNLFELAYTETERLVVPARTYPVELAHRGEKATLSVLGGVVQEAQAAARDSGNLLLWFHADAHLAVRKIVIEGRPTAEATDALREAWVAAYLEELGL